MMQLRNQDLEGKIGSIVVAQERQNKVIRDLKENIEVLKQQNQAQGERIEELEGKPLRK